MDHNLPSSSVHGIFQARILEWAASSFLQGIFSTQGSNPGLPHCRQMYRLSHQGSLTGESLFMFFFLWWKSRNINIPL